MSLDHASNEVLDGNKTSDPVPLAQAARLQRQAFLWEQEAFRLMERSRLARQRAQAIQLAHFRPTVVTAKAAPRPRGLYESKEAKALRLALAELKAQAPAPWPTTQQRSRAKKKKRRGWK